MADSWSGIADFEDYIAKARRDAEAEAMRACEMSAKELEARVKASLGKGDPRNGHLIDSVTAYKKDATTWAVKVGDSGLKYAAPLEFGHGNPDGSRTPPRKFFFPNVRIINKKHGRRIRRWFRKAIKDSGAL